MKDYIFLDRFGTAYYPMSNHSSSPLRLLAQFFATDYTFDNQDLFVNAVSRHHSTCVYNLAAKEIFYIAPFDFDLQAHIAAVEEYAATNRPYKDSEFILCKISYDNFIALSKKIFSLSQLDALHLLIYRNEDGWIDCKGFNCQNKMKQFMDYQIQNNPKRESSLFDIEGVSSIQTHLGFYSMTQRPRGAHSNFQGQSLQHFNPITITEGRFGVKDLLLRNPRLLDLTKYSTVYPENWDPFTCDKKAIEAMMNPEAKMFRMNPFGLVKIVGHTSENMEIVIFYEFKTKKIRMHYPHMQ